MFTLFRCHVSILTLFLFKQKGYEAQLTLSGAEDLVRKPGDSVTMKFTVQESGSATYNTTGHYTRWNKFQYWEGVKEQSALVNGMTVQFTGNNRITHTFDSSRLEYALHISNVEVNDNGIYRFNVDRVGSIESNLSVIEQDWLRSINIYSSQEASKSWRDLQPVDLITVDDGTPGSVYCVVNVTVQFASVSIFIDDEPGFYSALYSSDRYCTQLDREGIGLRRLSCNMSLGSSSFTAEYVRNFKCVVQPHSSQPGIEKAALIYIRGTPFITEECQSEVNVTIGEPYIIKCLFKSVPQPSRVLWQDQEVKDLTETENYVTEMEVKEGDDIEARLRISQVRKQDFQIYTLLAVIDGQETVLTQIQLKGEGGRNAQYDQQLLMVTVVLAAIFTGIDFL